MSRSSASVSERDFWSQEDLKYSRPHHRMRKVAPMVNRLAEGKACRLLDVGCGRATLHMLLDQNYRPSPDATWRFKQPVPGLVESTSCIAAPASTRPTATSSTLRRSGGARPNASLSRGGFRPGTTPRVDFLGQDSVPPSGKGVVGGLRGAGSERRSLHSARYGAIFFDLIVDLRPPSTTQPTPLSVSAYRTI